MELVGGIWDNSEGSVQVFSYEARTINIHSLFNKKYVVLCVEQCTVHIHTDKFLNT